MTSDTDSYPVIDLFAGPGGLGEGFAQLKKKTGERVFKSVASIEADDHAHQTLTLRHFFRSFKVDDVPDAYYEYIAGWITRDQLIGQYPQQWREANHTSLKISLGNESHDLVKRTIAKGLGGSSKWVLVGGPPCQAYSLVGRSRMMGMEGFEEDKRHFLYREYLKVIIDHRPPVFVMENVKGLLSSRVSGELVVQRIFDDLSNPIKAVTGTKNGLRYRLYSLSTDRLLGGMIDPAEFVVRAELYGVPQARHRMFIIGVREEIDIRPSRLTPSTAPTLKQIVGNLPKIRSGVSRDTDSPERWCAILASALKSEWYYQLGSIGDREVLSGLDKTISTISKSPKRTRAETYSEPTAMREWFQDSRLKSLTLHEARSHMPSDLHRYLFATVYAEAHGVSPTLGAYPSALLPAHRSATQKQTTGMFEDRFRVQLPARVSTTITSHISKDGHYFIHYDPGQCRSLTVREAARLQTFPDNYHFEGPRTSQYHQIGNAVPPYLALQIAHVIREILDSL